MSIARQLAAEAPLGDGVEQDAHGRPDVQRRPSRRQPAHDIAEPSDLDGFVAVELAIG